MAFRPRSSNGIDYVVGWGRRRTALPAERFAKKHGVPLLRLEDGFVRSVFPGRRQPSVSLVIDDLGIYYDPRASRLERLIEREGRDASTLDAARRLVEQLVSHRLSKYNAAAYDADARLANLPSEFVLIVDQVASDESVRLGAAGGTAFEAMVEAAVAENPGAAVLIKGHPAARARGGSAIGKARSIPPDVLWIHENINTHLLLERAARVYVASSQVGLEALFHRKPVTCFGTPFYAGWGLTDDRRASLRSAGRRSLEELVAAAYVDYTRYVDPVTGERCSALEAVAHLIHQQSCRAANNGRIFCFGFPVWKRPHVRPYLQSASGELVFVSEPRLAERRGFGPQSRAVVWGSRRSTAIEKLCRTHGVRLERMEDGFIRSVGLGSDLTPPRSLVLDRTGVYYDPSRASDLEVILSQHSFQSSELQRAERLVARLKRLRLSKYNPRSRVLLTLPRQTSKPVILVPGQVENDASLRCGAGAVKTNLELLQAVRKASPDAFVLFKPHPDVEAGNRPGSVADALALQYCDRVIRDVSVVDAIEVSDEVHTMTSLVGFEALLRDRRVVTYGQPFYSGWGLTEDRIRCSRRRRVLALNELAAGVLLRYPHYVDPASGYFATPEQTVTALEREVTRGSQALRIAQWPAGHKLLRTRRYLAAAWAEIWG